MQKNILFLEREKKQIQNQHDKLNEKLKKTNEEIDYLNQKILLQDK